MSASAFLFQRSESRGWKTRSRDFWRVFRRKGNRNTFSPHISQPPWVHTETMWEPELVFQTWRSDTALKSVKDAAPLLGSKIFLDINRTKKKGTQKNKINKQGEGRVRIHPYLSVCGLWFCPSMFPRRHTFRLAGTISHQRARVMWKIIFSWCEQLKKPSHMHLKKNERPQETDIVAFLVCPQVSCLIQSSCTPLLSCHFLYTEM